MKNARLLIALLTLVLVGGCNNDGPKESGMALIQTTNPSAVTLNKHTREESDLIEAIETDIEGFKELYDVAVVKGKKDILVAYKVKHLQRFRMKQIEKKVIKHLEDKYPNENFTVSSDYKIFLEAVELEKNMKNPNYSPKKAEDKLQEIIKLQKELT
ncbi:YhcN/YlaJ family sporulation lipoprotein [Robertmurraya andreesenii]|uniref:Sporulation protein n=1 Tax=Anoxybacillus andreesenii TaxID=1325932 RepID=A0ABT9UZ06_9BACL|nr:YhcN/YlaJ family sporulation lipoprotein [Robertmurraya andreesenii]MDQ0153925.1 hypothetical protein [Robertmurraya andreesenii]